MSDQDATTPRVFLARHGETEWTINGRYTGVTELDLTPRGVGQVRASGAQLVGPGRLLDPASIVRIFVSPRKRAQTTLGLLFGDGEASQVDASKVVTTDEIAEWDYGDYEGLLTKEIRELRASKGLDTAQPWDIWRDGCEGGETAQQVTARLDALIQKIYDIQRDNMHGEHPADVVLVAHGHILRAFVKRWLLYPTESPLPLMMSPGAIGVLSYDNHSIQEPAIMVGLSMPSST
ncbi:Phosphoglycerate mutase [Cordyceps militaris]|uniref:Phosphoglycerate mutase n=1 Tax=Cordyceps militaris TaxID=73501 RepID=A0A2H4SAI7_CORMI|nr:Phosphoglycerate mutase [Cordyceps militaris]